MQNLAFSADTLAQCFPNLANGLATSFFHGLSPETTTHINLNHKMMSLEISLQDSSMIITALSFFLARTRAHCESDICEE